MKSYNHVTLVGELTENPQLKEDKTSFVLQVNRSDKDESDLIPVIAEGKLAKLCYEYLQKGKQILVDGRIQINECNVSEVVVSEVTILNKGLCFD